MSFRTLGKKISRGKRENKHLLQKKKKKKKNPLCVARRREKKFSWSYSLFRETRPVERKGDLGRGEGEKKRETSCSSLLSRSIV